MSKQSTSAMLNRCEDIIFCGDTKLSNDREKCPHKAHLVFWLVFPNWQKSLFGTANLPKVYYVGFISSLPPKTIWDWIDKSEVRPRASEFTPGDHSENVGLLPSQTRMFNWWYSREFLSSSMHLWLSLGSNGCLYVIRAFSDCSKFVYVSVLHWCVNSCF